MTAPPVLNANAPLVVTAPRLVAPALLTRLIVPVFAASVAKLLPVLVSVYVPPLPFRVSAVAVNAAVWVPAPVVVSDNALPFVFKPAFSAMPPVPDVSDVAPVVVTALPIVMPVPVSDVTFDAIVPAELDVTVPMEVTVNALSLAFTPAFSAIPPVPAVSDVAPVVVTAPPIVMPVPVSNVTFDAIVPAELDITAPIDVSVRSPPRVFIAPSSEAPPEPETIDTSKGLVELAPIDPVPELMTTAPAFAVNASDVVLLPERLIAALTTTLPPVDSSNEEPSPKLTAPPTVIAPPLVTLSAPVVVTGPTFVASILASVIAPVLPVSVLMLLLLLLSVYVAPLPSRLTVVALNAPGCVTTPPVVNVNAPVVVTAPKLVAVAAFFRLMLLALLVPPPVVSEPNMLSSAPSVNVPPPLSVNAPAVNVAVWLAVPVVVSVSAPPCAMAPPPNVLIGPRSEMPPKPLVIATSNALVDVDPIDPPVPIVTPLSAALAVNASDPAALPVRLIAAFTVTLPPVDSSFDMPSPMLTAAPTVSAPTLVTFSAPVVVTGPTLSAVMTARLMLPVLPVSVLMLLPLLSSVYAPPLPSRLTVVALSAPGCVTTPLVVNVNAPVVATLSKLVVAAMFFRSMLAALPMAPVVSEPNMLSSIPSVNVPPPFSVNAPAVNAAVWLAVPVVVSVSAPPCARVPPPSVLIGPPSVMPPEPLVIATSNALVEVDPIAPPVPIITPLSAALAVSASEAAAVPVRLIAAFTTTLPPVDVSEDMPLPMLTTSPTVNVPTLVTFSAPVVVTDRTLVAIPMFLRSMLAALLVPLPVVSELKLLSCVASR